MIIHRKLQNLLLMASSFFFQPGWEFQNSYSLEGNKFATLTDSVTQGFGTRFFIFSFLKNSKKSSLTVGFH